MSYERKQSLLVGIHPRTGGETGCFSESLTKHRLANIRFDHGFEVLTFCCDSSPILMPESTEKPWLNAIITQTKLISNP